MQRAMQCPDSARSLAVMVFLHSFEPGGVERVALRLCNSWQHDPGLDIRLVMGRTDGVMRAEAPPGLPLHVTSSRGIPTAAWETLWMVLVLYRQVRRERPDVLFAAGNSYAIVAVAIKLMLGRNCPPIVLKVSNDLARLDMPLPIRCIYYLWLRVQGRMIDHFTGLAAPMHAEISEAMRVDGDRVTVIPDPALGASEAATLEAVGDARITSASRRYVAVGRLAPQKNFPLLLQAFALAAGPHDSLAIIGEGEERRKLEALITELNLTGRVAMPGHGDVAPALQAADVFVLSSDYEALPAVVVEALASGIPVVATDCSVSMRSLVGLFGTIVPRRDVTALAAAMQAQAPLSASDRRGAFYAMQTHTVERAARLYGQVFTQLSRQWCPENAILTP